MNINELLKRNEGFSKHPYNDTRGLLTIGYGRNLEAKGISEAEALMMLQDDRRMFEMVVRQALGDDTPPAGTARYAALVDMAFTLGRDGFNDFDDMIGAIKDGDWYEAKQQVLDSLWAKKEAPLRAERDAKMILTDKWPGED